MALKHIVVVMGESTACIVLSGIAILYEQHSRVQDALELYCVASVNICLNEQHEKTMQIILLVRLFPCMFGSGYWNSGSLMLGSMSFTVLRMS